MRVRTLSAFLTISVATGLSANPEAPQVVEIQAFDPVIRAQLGLLFGHIGYDGTNGIATVEADAWERERLTDAGISWRVDEEASRTLRAFVDASASGLRAIPGYACYRTVEETFDTIDALVATHPELASFVDIGESWRKTQNPAQGYPMRVLRLGNSKISGPKPILFAMSSVHAREYAPAELMTRFAEQLLAGYGKDADSTWLLDRHEFHLLLHANPDGRKRAEQEVLWRKNENTTHCPQANGNPVGNVHPGVDLNRNFSWGWNSVTGGSSGTPCAATFRGPSAASEPETQAVRDYVQSVFPDTRPGSNTSLVIPADETTQGMFLDMHSYGGLMLWPWGTSDAVTGNMAAFERLGRRLAWFNEHQPQQAIELYATDGTTTDFAYGELGIPAFTFEIGTQFFQNCATFESTVLPINLASLHYAARVLHAPYRLPAGPDVYNASLDLAQVMQGDTVTITATVNDGRYRLGNASTPVHTIEGARVYTDQMPWDEGATGIEMSAVDGSFDEPIEEVRLVFDTASLESGRHLLFVQGHDSAGEHGPPAAAFLVIEPNNDLIFTHDFEIPPPAH